MITKSEAEKIAYDHINTPDTYWKEKPEMVIIETEERKENWIVYWTSKLYLETKEVSHALAGNGPILVSKHTGKFEAVGTAPPLNVRIKEAESSLKSSSNQSEQDNPITRP